MANAAGMLSNLKPGVGRPKGSPNKAGALIKDMILQALDMQGGPEYMCFLAKEHPQAFTTLLGKVLPLQITGADGGALEYKLIQDDVSIL